MELDEKTTAISPARELWTRPEPEIDLDIAPFWDGLGRHEFLLNRCSQCDAWYWPASYCRHHANLPWRANMEWQPSSGLGVIHAYNVHYVAFRKEFEDFLPLPYALILLDEGPMFGTNIVDIDPDDVRIGLRVGIKYVDVVTASGRELTMPMFAPAATK